MKKFPKELLTYELYHRDNDYHISIPVHNLSNPKFLLKENNLLIFLYDYERSYIIKNVPPEVLLAIKNGCCYLTENLDQEQSISHIIKLFP